MLDYKKLAETAAKLPGYLANIQPLVFESPHQVNEFYNYGYKVGYNKAVFDFIQALMNPKAIIKDGHVVIETEEDGIKRYWTLPDCKEAK